MHLERTYFLNGKFKYAVKVFTKTVGVLSALALICASVFQMVSYFQSEERNTKYKHFNNIIIDNELDRQMTVIDDFIKQKAIEGKTVYILDRGAAVYMIPLDRYNKNYDMFNIGNFGGKGNKGVIEDIKTKENAIFLISQDEYPVHWQCPTEITDYVKENYKKVDSIAVYDAYEKNY